MDFGKVNVHLLRHPKVDEVANVPVKVIHIKNKRFSSSCVAHGNKSDSSVSVVHYNRTPDRLKQNVKRREGDGQRKTENGLS